jgi:hypothetical protein
MFPDLCLLFAFLPDDLVQKQIQEAPEVVSEGDTLPLAEVLTMPFLQKLSQFIPGDQNS